MNTNFCQKLKEARRIKEFTQKQVAIVLGIAESSYANWELGRTEPNTSYLQKLCVLLDISANYLLGLEDEAGTPININGGINYNNGNIQIGGQYNAASNKKGKK